MRVGLYSWRRPQGQPTIARRLVFIFQPPLHALPRQRQRRGPAYRAGRLQGPPHSIRLAHVVLGPQRVVAVQREQTNRIHSIQSIRIRAHHTSRHIPH